MPTTLKPPVDEAATDVRQLLRNDPMLLMPDVTLPRKLSIGSRSSEFRREATGLIDDANTDPALSTRAGVVAYLLARHQRAVDLLEHAEGGPAAYFRGLALLSLDRLPEAEAAFAAAEQAGFDKPAAVLKRAEAIRRQGRVEEAETTIRSVGKLAASRAEYSFQMGCIMADRDDLDGAIEYFERAADINPHHPGALFRLGNIAATHGEEAEAIRFYEGSLAVPPLHQGAMLNLGLLYEDTEQYRAAAYCFRKVLEVDPNNSRARLYLRDIEATDTMYYDEEFLRLDAKRQLLLSKSIADFELTVRSRNCLQGMGINTLGDLTRISEAELLAGKNFGETSLQEVNDLLAQHNLRIGESVAEEQRPRSPLAAITAVSADVSPQEQALLSRTIADMDFSVRARKCMSRLGITTVGDLTSRTPDELLSARNFGVTSLNEIRQKLGEIGAKLRND